MGPLSWPRLGHLLLLVAFTSASATMGLGEGAREAPEHIQALPDGMQEVVDRLRTIGQDYFSGLGNIEIEHSVKISAEAINTRRACVSLRVEPLRSLDKTTFVEMLDALVADNSMKAAFKHAFPPAQSTTVAQVLLGHDTNKEKLYIVKARGKGEVIHAVECMDENCDTKVYELRPVDERLALALHPRALDVRAFLPVTPKAWHMAKNGAAESAVYMHMQIGSREGPVVWGGRETAAAVIAWIRSMHPRYSAEALSEALDKHKGRIVNVVAVGHDGSGVTITLYLKDATSPADYDDHTGLLVGEELRAPANRARRLRRSRPDNEDMEGGSFTPFLFLPPPPPPPPLPSPRGETSVDVVVARFHEDVSWIAHNCLDDIERHEPAQFVVYNHGALLRVARRHLGAMCGGRVRVVERTDGHNNATRGGGWDAGREAVYVDHILLRSLAGGGGLAALTVFMPAAAPAPGWPHGGLLWHAPPLADYVARGPLWVPTEMWTADGQFATLRKGYRNVSDVVGVGTTTGSSASSATRITPNEGDELDASETHRGENLHSHCAARGADGPSKNFCRTLFQIERAALHSSGSDFHSCVVLCNFLTGWFPWENARRTRSPESLCRFFRDYMMEPFTKCPEVFELAGEAQFSVTRDQILVRNELFYKALARELHSDGTNTALYLRATWGYLFFGKALYAASRENEFCPEDVPPLPAIPVFPEATAPVLKPVRRLLLTHSTSARLQIKRRLDARQISRRRLLAPRQLDHAWSDGKNGLCCPASDGGKADCGPCSATIDCGDGNNYDKHKPGDVECPTPVPPPAPPPPCVWTAWGAWACGGDLNCGDPVTRERVGNPENCMQDSPEMQSGTASSKCDCCWGGWSVPTQCSSSCGAEGTTTKTRNKVGTCSGSQTATPVPCQAACDESCWSSWSKWGTCYPSCGSGTTKRTRTSANECKGEAEEESAPCSSCLDSCWDTWAGWGSCNNPCGSGTKSRTKTSACHVAEEESAPCSECASSCWPVKILPSTHCCRCGVLHCHS